MLPSPRRGAGGHADQGQGHRQGHHHTGQKKAQADHGRAALEVPGRASVQHHRDLAHDRLQGTNTRNTRVDIEWEAR